MCATWWVTGDCYTPQAVRERGHDPDVRRGGLGLRGSVTAQEHHQGDQ